MRFKGLDLNLLVAFDTLMETRSVSRAAEHMHLSQPAMSAALSRLRDYFKDPILVSHAKRMYPTAYAESLLPQIRDCLRVVDSLIATSAQFDPATSQRVFRLIMSDYITAAVAVPLVARLADIAPQVRIEIILPTDQSSELIEQGKVDLLVTPDDFIARDQPAELLFEERHVLVGWSGNPLFAGPITEADILAAGHVAVHMGNQRTPAFGDRHMDLLGKIRRIEVTTSSFTTVPWLLRDTQRLALMHERLVRAMATTFPISFAELPFDFPTMREMIQYNHARGADEGLRWMRRQLHAIAAGEEGIHEIDGSV